MLAETASLLGVHITNGWGLGTLTSWKGSVVVLYDLATLAVFSHSLPQALNAARRGPLGAGNRLGPAGSLSCIAESSALRRTLEPRHFIECLLSSQKVTYSVPQCQL